MVKENSEKKWLAVLVILVVLVLVVELLSLNVLYRLADKNNLQGQLATNPSSGNPKSKNYNPCDACGVDWSDCVKSCGKNPTQTCLVGCDSSYDSCMYDNNC
jgi:hypothetical protein